MDKCNDLMGLPLEKVVEILRTARSCFNCLKPNHIAKFCRSEGFKCGKCGLLHPTILCGLRQLQQQQRLEKEEESKKSTGTAEAASNGKGNGEKKAEGKGKTSAGGSGSRSGQNNENPVNLNNA